MGELLVVVVVVVTFVVMVGFDWSPRGGSNAQT